MRCRLAKRGIAQTFPKCQVVDPSEWTLAAYGSFFREENMMVLEARSILYPVRYAEGRRPLGRLLVLSDTFLRWCWRSASAKDAQTFLLWFQSCVQYLRLFSGKVLFYRSGGNRYIFFKNFDKGSRFFDRDYEPSK